MSLQTMNLLKSFVREGITHIEDLSIDEFISAVENLKEKTVTEKLDGSNLWFGLDGKGFFTSREAKSKGKRFYSVDDYPMVASHNGFRGAHLALERHTETIKKHLQDGDLVEIEVLFGSQPNTVNYGHTDRNFIVILRGIETDQKKVDALAEALNNKQSKVTSAEITSDDGQELKKTDVEQNWHFSQVKPVDVQSTDIEEAKTKLEDLKKYLKEPNAKVKGKTNKEIAEISLTSVHKDVRDAVKAEREVQLKYILDNYKKPIKEILLDKLVRKVKPFLQSPTLDPANEIGVEGVVATDKKGNMVKIVDKDVWTAINKFNNQVRNDVSGLVRTDNKDAPIEMRGGAFGQAKIRIAELFGMKDLALSSGTKKLITKFKGADAAETVNNLASSIKLASFESSKEKVGAILKSAIAEIDGILGDFKQNAGSYKLKLGTGKEIGISPEIMKRNLTAFAETKRDINQVITAVLKSRDLPELLTALYGKTVQGLFSGDSDVKESKFSLIKMLEDGEGGEGGAPAEPQMATTSGAIAPVMFKLMGGKVITRRPRKYKKKRAFESLKGKSLLKLVEFDTLTQTDKFAKGVGDNISAKSDVEFKSLRNSLTVSGDELATSDVSRYLNKAHELNDEVDTVTFGMEMDDGSVVKVYVNQEHAEGFERALADLLGQEDDIEKVIDMMADEYDIVDVEWPNGTLQSQEDDLNAIAADGQTDTSVEPDLQTGEDGQIGDGTTDGSQPQVEPIIQLGDDSVDDEADDASDDSLLKQIDATADEKEASETPDLSTLDDGGEEPAPADDAPPTDDTPPDADETTDVPATDEAPPTEGEPTSDTPPPDDDTTVDLSDETPPEDDDEVDDTDPDNPGGGKKKKKKKSDEDSSDTATDPATKESQMSLGQRFKEKLLTEKAAPKAKVEDKKKKKEEVPEEEHGFPAGVQKLMNEFPNAGAKMMIGLLFVMGVPLDALVMKKSELKKTVEPAADKYMKDGQFRMWVKRFITSVQESNKPAVQEAGLDKELSNSIQKMVFAVMQQAGLPDSVEKLARAAIRNAVKSLAAQIQGDSKIRVNLKALAEIFGIDVTATAAIKEGKNHLGNAEYASWSSWRAAAKAAAAKADLGTVWFEGDKDIAQAFVGANPYKKGSTFAIGEWDGSKGDINQDSDLADTKKRMSKVTESEGEDLQDALNALKAAIEKGGEFPDEAHRVATKFKVKQADLEKAYDALHEEVGETGVDAWVTTVKALATKLGVPAANLAYRANQVDMSIKQTRPKIKNVNSIQRKLEAILALTEEVEGEIVAEGFKENPWFTEMRKTVKSVRISADASRDDGQWIKKEKALTAIDELVDAGFKKSGSNSKQVEIYSKESRKKGLTFAFDDEDAKAEGKVIVHAWDESTS